MHPTRLPTPIKRRLLDVLRFMQTRSIRAAAQEQGLASLSKRLAEIVPDIRKQYSAYELETPFQQTAIRSLHAFQTSVACDAIRQAERTNGGPLTVVDIGDSAGTHLLYLQGLLGDIELSCIGLNLDGQAVERIRSNGVEAIQCRAEDLTSRSVNADVFLSFETLEHLTDPVRMLKSISYGTECQTFAISVPYVPKSRAGLYHIRQNSFKTVTAEDTHIFEFSPPDWRLLLRHAGWEVVSERVYLQYPRRRLWRGMKPIWGRTETFGTHEGFWGAVLRRNHDWSDLYTDW